MNALDPALSERVQRCGRQAYIIHGEMNAVEAPDGAEAFEAVPLDGTASDPDADAIAFVKAVAAAEAAPRSPITIGSLPASPPCPMRNGATFHRRKRTNFWSRK